MSRKSELQGYINTGLSTYKIAKIYNVSQSCVSLWLKKYGIKPVNKFCIKGGKRSWEVVTEESNIKRSKSLKGIFHKRKSGNYNPSKLVKCDYCKNEFSKKQSIIDKTKYNFCDMKCCGEWKSENLNGDSLYNFKGNNKNYYGLNWTRQRRLCRRRDKNRCNVCILTSLECNRNMSVDHVVPFKEFDSYLIANKLQNLWCLCISCHIRKTNLQVKLGNIGRVGWKEVLVKYI